MLYTNCRLECYMLSTMELPLAPLFVFRKSYKFLTFVLTPIQSLSAFRTYYHFLSSPIVFCNIIFYGFVPSFYFLLFRWAHRNKWTANAFSDRLILRIYKVFSAGISEFGKPSACRAGKNVRINGCFFQELHRFHDILAISHFQLCSAAVCEVRKKNNHIRRIKHFKTNFGLVLISHAGRKQCRVYYCESGRSVSFRYFSKFTSVVCVTGYLSGDIYFSPHSPFSFSL